MDPILALIDNTTNIIPGGGQFPTTLLFATHLISRIHWVWCWHIQYTSVFTESGNLKKYLAGCALNTALGTSSLLRGAAQVILVTRRIVDCGRQKVKVYRAWLRVGDAWSASYITQVRVQVDMSREQESLLQQIVSPSTYIWVESNRQAAVLFAGEVGSSLKELLWELLHLTVCYRLVMEACSLDPSVRSSAVNELFLHSSKLFEEISGNKKGIHSELVQNKEVVGQVLRTLGLEWTADGMISAVGSSLSAAEAVYSIGNSLANTVGNGAKDGLWTLLHSTLGWAPSFLLPDKA